jgi:hypothetical protein
MPSKGIQCYSYNCIPDCQIEFSVPKKVVVKTQLNQYTVDHLEVDKANISGVFNYSGIFRCRVTQNGNEIMNKWVQINSLTGNMEQGNMKNMVDQVSVVSNNICIAFTLWDSPENKNSAGLSTWDQFYVTVSPNYSSWMSNVAPPGTAAASKPFTRFVLPAAHDIGMNSMQNADACLQNVPTQFFGLLTSLVSTFKLGAGSATKAITSGLAPNIIQGLSITQKDTLNTILNIGARYFEFRPAYLHNLIRPLKPIPDKLYFMHGPIPGMGYDEFLAGVVDFLLKNPGEIIVVQLRWDGVPKECAQPTPQELSQYLNQALGGAGGAIKAGTLDDMTQLSIEALRTQQKRLILLQDVNSYSTYSDQGNATLTGDSIIAEFQQLAANNQNGKAFTNIQCQATATNLKDVVVYSALTANTSNSCLLCTKSVCDNKTMPWIRDNALGKLTAEQLIVIMDDFVDGGMCDLARGLSVQRLGR